MSEETIGERLRRLRIERGHGLRAFAALVQVSPGLISQIETGRAQPSMATLLAIVSTLGISYDELLGPGGVPPAAVTIERADGAPVLDIGDGVRWQHLAGGPEASPEAIVVTIAPGGSTSADGGQMSHPGMELVVILEGRLHLRVEGRTHDLGPGDSVRFDAALPHVYRNEGDRDARGIWIVASSPRPAPRAGRPRDDAPLSAD